MQGITQSIAGRAAVLYALPLSVTESERVTLLSGGYPEAVASPKVRELRFSFYIETYLERDVRAIMRVRDRATFRRFLALLASRNGQLLNHSDRAAPLGISVPTVSAWLHVLEITGQVMLVPPYFENFGKRVLKTPQGLLPRLRTGMPPVGHPVGGGDASLAFFEVLFGVSWALRS